MKNISLFLVFMGGVFGESVTVKEGDSVTLNTNLTKIDNVIEWRFNGNRIARVRKDEDPTYDDDLDGTFKERLKMDRQTGDLTISKIQTTDAGEYKVSDSIDKFKKIFSVSVSGSGLSGGAITGIVFAVAAVIAAVGGIYYGYRKKGQVL